jgi:hypothetical protein
MQEKRLWLLMLLMSLYVSAQTKGVVVDESGKPIPYVNIWVENENIGTTSEVDGGFSLEIKEEKILVFSVLGFQTRRASSTISENVILTQQLFQLNEVLIEKPKNSKTVIIGNSKKINFSYWSGKKPWIFAKKFDNKFIEDDLQFIKKAIIYTKSKIANASFKLRIFSVDESGFPKEDVLPSDIIVYVKKGKYTNEIDLQKYHLRIPDEGIFVAFEWLILESNKFEYKDNENGNNQYTYEPAIIVNPVEREMTYKYINAKWIKSEKSPKFEIPFLADKIIEPAINLILTN